MINRWEIRVYFDGEFDKAFRFFRKRDLMWAQRMISLIGPRASCKLIDRWTGHEIT